MKEWERKLRSEQEKGRCSLGNRLLYAFIGFVSAGALSFFVVYVAIAAMAGSHRYTPPYDAYSIWIAGGIAVLGAGCTLFFTVWGFFRGDRMLQALGGLWEDFMNRDKD